MKIVISIGLGIIFLLVLSTFISQCNKPPVVIPPNDTTYVKGDTVWIKSDTTFIVKWKRLPALIDTVYLNDSVETTRVSSEVDSMFVHNKDTITVIAKVDYYPDFNYFDWFMSIEHRDYDFQRIDTLKIAEYIPVEVKVTDPLWIISTIVATLLLAVALIFGG